MARERSSDPDEGVERLKQSSREALCDVQGGAHTPREMSARLFLRLMIFVSASACSSGGDSPDSGAGNTGDGGMSMTTLPPAAPVSVDLPAGLVEALEKTPDGKPILIKTTAMVAPGESLALVWDPE